MRLGADRPAVPISELSIEAVAPGAKAGVWAHVAGDLTGPVRLPILLARGSERGRTLVAAAGVHGNEYEGMEAIRLVFERLDPRRMIGVFLGLPVANPAAYAARSRSAPPDVDGLDLARVFPGDADGSPSRLLAHHLLALVERNVGPDDLFVDFHSGSGEVAFATLVGFRDVPGAARERSEEAARRFGLADLWRIPDAPGPFNAETARRGIPTIGTETTGRAGCDPLGVAAFVDGVSNLLGLLEIVPGERLPERYDGPARPTVDIVSPATGFLRVAAALGDRVEAGQLLGTVVSIFGEPLAEIRAPANGTIWARRTTPAIRRGELSFMVAG